MNIHLQQDGEEKGPFTWIEVFVMLQKGGISCDTLARSEDEDGWRTIDEIGLWREGDEIGPFTWEEVEYLVSEGVLDARVQVRPEGEESLSSLEEVRKVGYDAETNPEAITAEAEEPASLPRAGFPGLPVLLVSLRSAVLSRLQGRACLVGAVLVAVSFIAGWLTRGAFVKDEAQVVGTASALPAAGSPGPISVVREESPQTKIAPDALNEKAGSLPAQDQVEEKNAEAANVSAVKELGAVASGAKVESTSSAPPEDAPPQVATDVVPEKPNVPAGENAVSNHPLSAASTAPPRKAESRDQPPPQPAKSQAAAGKLAPSKVVRLRPFETPQLSEAELSEILEERFSSSPIVIPETYDERPGVGLQIFEGAFTLETKLVNNPTVEVIYRVPQRSKNSPGPDADNIVMVGIYHGAIQPRVKKIVDGKEVVVKSGLHGALTSFADRLGYTAFTFHIRTSPEMSGDTREYYAYGGPEWVDLVYRAKAEIERRHKLKDRKLLLFGTSEGGQFVQNIAAAAPEKVAAIAAQSGPNITPPQTVSSTAWFLAITRGDAMQGAYEAVYNRLLEQDATVAFNIFPPDYRGRGLGGNFYHSQSAIATTASRSYLRGVIDRLDSKGNIDRTRWPYVRDRTRPLRIYPMGSAHVKEIPLPHREYLPSKAVAQCLQAVPAPMQTVTLPTGGVKTVKAFVGIPPLGKPKGVLIYSQAFNFLELQHMFDNIYYLAAMGYVVIAPQMKKNDSADLLGAMHYARTAPVLNKYPMAVMGYGQKANIAWNAVARNPELAPKAVAMLEFSPNDSFDESKLPPGSRMDVPVVFVYDEAPLVEVATSEEAKKSGELVSSVKNFVTKCQERNQIAKVVIVQKPKPKNKSQTITEDEAKKLERIRVAQLSLEAAESFISNVVEKKTSRIKQ